jgi:hypothetical protein
MLKRVIPQPRRQVMKEARLTLPQLSMIAVTRAILGGGVGLLLADRLSERERRVAGWGLFLAGVVSTIPLGRLVLSRRHPKCALELDTERDEEAGSSI